MSVTRRQAVGVLAAAGVLGPLSLWLTSRETTSSAYDATFPVQLPEFGIAEPRYLGVGVRDQVQVRARFVAKADTSGSTR